MTGNSPDTARPLPSDLQSAGARKGCLECEAWLDRVAEEKAWLGFKSSVDAASRSETEGAAPASAAPEGCFPPPPAHHLELAKPTIRERAFDAAQRLVLSDPYAPTGFLAQNRMIKRILEVAGEFEEWMAEQPPIDCRSLDDQPEACMSGWDAEPAEPSVRAATAELRPDAAPKQGSSADNSIPARTADAIMGVVIQMAKDIATFEAVANQLDKRRRAL